MKWPGHTFWISALAVAAALSLAAKNHRAFAAEGSSDEQEARIAELIEQLGSDQYATREKAQARLRALGLAAFDSLLEARNHRDIEVAIRVRYLLRGMPVAWVRDSDSVAVKSVLRNYGQQGRDDRINRMQLLAGLDNGQGVEALCRIMRFEVDSVLSKKAALQLFAIAAPDELPAKKELAAKIRAAVGTSRRPAADWVRTYATSLTAPQTTLETWNRLAQREIETLANNPEDTQADVVRDLLRWHVDQLRQLGHQDEATTTIGKIIELVDDNFEDLFDFVDWALEREAWFVPEKLAERFPSEYHRRAYLVYRLAEARRKLGKEAAAQEAADEALKIDPDRFQRHVVLARYLRSRQLFDWSEKEFRYVIGAAKQQKEYELEAREYLSQMLFDMQRENEAADVLSGSVAIVNQDPTAFRAIVSEAELQSTVDYYRAMHYGRAGDFGKQKELLKKAIANNPANIDIVIAMYRVPKPEPAWRDETTKILTKTVTATRVQLRELRQGLSETRDAGEREQLEAQLAKKNNELAWLVSNTEGDFQEALACSQESLRLMPGTWAYQDTLGRCYFAVGDIKNAVEQQSAAVKGAPYLQQMRRQLQMFQEALAKSQK